MFKELLEKKRYSFHDGFESWEEAIAAACKPLIEDGAVLEDYVDLIIKNVKEYGPYIVIAPDICIPHAQEGRGVNETAVCLMKTKKPVHFSDSPEHDARLFFVLASTDNSIHLQNLSELVEYLSDESMVKKLLEAESVEDIKALI
ncbi:PTS system IIA component, L-Asc family [Caloramator quimbayensis]|uniref:Ascorbate-specific PTS system EIIA component n=1 Tax=Caloramator quimbayensis TaxID=1147123 RepID=A0A1T4WDY3_9CLOT|nr:PTS sugar transporter subunit IIA [Caloramator quimbayensis]SKA75503.1 PTS system IIA component, L-Asc family [Caloramator quimbayensis]